MSKSRWTPSLTIINVRTVIGSCKSRATKYFSRFSAYRCWVYTEYRCRCCHRLLVCFFLLSWLLQQQQKLRRACLCRFTTTLSSEKCKFSWHGSTRLGYFAAELLRLRFTGLLLLYITCRKLQIMWNNSFTYSITFHGVNLILRLEPASEPKNLGAEPAVLKWVTYTSIIRAGASAGKREIGQFNSRQAGTQGSFPGTGQPA